MDHMTTSLRMDKNWTNMTERIFNLTLEIMCLLTRESFSPVKSGNHVTIPVPPPHSLISEGHNKQKILEVTRKMIELLTGEYLEGYQDLYKDAMMENQPPLTSPDVSSNRNPPERCTGPLYFRDCPQEGHGDSGHYEGEELIYMKIEVKEEEEEFAVWGVQPSTEKEVMMGSDKHEKSATDKQPPEEGKTKRTIKEEDIFQEINIDCTVESNVIVQDAAIPGSPRPSSLQDGHNEGQQWSKKPRTCLGFQSNQYTTETPALSNMSHVCSECGKCFSQETELATHRWSHGSERLHSCPECGKSFGYKSLLDAHQRSHTGEKPYSCPQCGKCFGQKSQLTTHERSHSGDKPYPCPECGKSFGCKSRLDRHRKSHRGERPYSCPECEKCFESKSYLSTHIRSHTGEKPFSCPECGKCFAYKSNLVVHQRSHTGEKPYSCPACGRCFAQKAHLADHFISHTGEKPFLCPECGKCFGRKSYLMTHQRTHTGEKPYSCPECGKCFEQKSQLAEHRRLHSGDKLYSRREWEMIWAEKFPFQTAEEANR